MLLGISHWMLDDGVEAEDIQIQNGAKLDYGSDLSCQSFGGRDCETKGGIFVMYCLFE